MKTLFKSRHANYSLTYYIIWTTKYKKPILTGEIKQEIAHILEAVANEKQWQLQTLAIQPDHIYLTVSAPPTVSPANIVKSIKGMTARRFLLRYPHLASRTGRGALWAPSYYISTKTPSDSTITRYIAECQDH